MNKKDLTYSVILLIISTTLSLTNAEISRHIQSTYNQLFDGEPMPAITELAFNYPNILIIFTIPSTLMVALSIKNYKYTNDLTVGLCFLMLIIVPMIAYAYSLPMLSILVSM